MERFLEFAVNHYILVAIFVALLIALLLLESMKGGKKVSPQEAVTLINRDQAVVVDIRERKEVKEGRITGSIHMPLNNLKDHLHELKKHEGKQIIVVDKMGQHSAGAVKQLNEAGYANVTRLNGGINEWRAASLPLVKK